MKEALFGKVYKMISSVAYTGNSPSPTTIPQYIKGNG